VNDSEVSSKKIKVVDRRRFTEDGTLREDRPGEARKAPAQTSAPSAESEPSPEPDPTPEPGAAPEIDPSLGSGPATATSQDFLELVAMLAQQAELMLMGAEGLEPQPDQAHRLIDYLGALESKTRGNVSAEEAQLLSNLVFQLRTMYVQQANP